MIGILLFGLFAFGERGGTAGEGDGVKGVAVGYGCVVDFGYEAVVELLLLFGLGAVLTVTQYYNTSLLSGYK